MLAKPVKSERRVELQARNEFFKISLLNISLGGGRSILLSYRDIYEISLILRGFSRFVQGDDLYFRGKIH